MGAQESEELSELAQHGGRQSGALCTLTASPLGEDSRQAYVGSFWWLVAGWWPFSPRPVALSTAGRRPCLVNCCPSYELSVPTLAIETQGEQQKPRITREESLTSGQSCLPSILRFILGAGWLFAVGLPDCR